MFIIDDKNNEYYDFVKRTTIKEQNVEVIELCHKVTKMNVILLDCEDENRAFNIAFKTPVNDSKGTPHILEHSVLCGSRKYNVKDPFVELAKGSLNTFLNAMTFPDKTCYPVASANLKDFKNLVDVYLDAVFYPNVIENEKLFRQEGWHYEVDEKTNEFIVNGVVYNEMKGVFSDPDSILEYSVLSNLFKGTNYAYESGGKPSDIINLTYEEFKNFHHKYYSPSNAVVYLYGKLNYNEWLAYLQDKYLKDFNYVNCDANFNSIIKKEKKSLMTTYYNVDTNDVSDKSYIAYSFSIGEEKESLKYIILHIIDYILFTSDSALLKEKLLNLGLGKSIASKYEVGLKTGYYSIVAQNIDSEKKDMLISTIDEFINELVTSGIGTDKLKAAINYVYFCYAEDEYRHTPKGLVASLISLDSYLYGKGSTEFLFYENQFDILNSIDLNDRNNIIYKTIREVFIDNNHTAINMLLPKYGYSNENEEKLKKIINDRTSNLPSAEIEKIKKDCVELKRFQAEKDTEEALACIPRCKPIDIEREKDLIDYVVENDDNVDTIISYDNKKDIIYIGLSFDITSLSKEEIYLFALIQIILGRLDLSDEKVIDFENYVDTNTGGLTVSFEIFEKRVLFSYSIKVTNNNIDKAFDIFYRLFSKAIFEDTNKINILINEAKTNSMLHILSSGHISASNRARSDNSFQCYIADKVSSTGIAFFLFLSNLCEKYKNNADLINESLALLYKKLHRKKLYLKLCMNKKYHDEVITAYDSFSQKIFKNKMKNIYTENDEKKLLENIEKIKKIIPFDDFDKKVKREAIITPNDVNFCALSGKFDEKLYSGKLGLLSTLFNYEYLWTNIRVLGGAYGCMSNFNREGCYSFVSYRDPNLSKTNNTFLGVKKYLEDSKFTKDEIDKYIIGSMGTYDNPLSTYEKHKRNVASYFNGNTNVDINNRRHDVLDTVPSDINKSANVFADIENASMCALINIMFEEEAKTTYDSIWTLME